MDAWPKGCGRCESAALAAYFTASCTAPECSTLPPEAGVVLDLVRLVASLVLCLCKHLLHFTREYAHLGWMTFLRLGVGPLYIVCCARAAVSIYMLSSPAAVNIGVLLYFSAEVQGALTLQRACNIVHCLLCRTQSLVQAHTGV